MRNASKGSGKHIKRSRMEAQEAAVSREYLNHITEERAALGSVTKPELRASRSPLSRSMKGRSQDMFASGAQKNEISAERAAQRVKLGR